MNLFFVFFLEYIFSEKKSFIIKCVFREVLEVRVNPTNENMKSNATWKGIIEQARVKLVEKESLGFKDTLG